MHEVSSAHASSGTCITFHEARASASTVGGQAELETMNERPPTGCGERAIDGRVLVREVRLQFQADSGANQPVTSASAAVGSDAVRLGKLEEGRFDAILPCDTRARARALLFWVLHFCSLGFASIGLRAARPTGQFVGRFGDSDCCPCRDTYRHTLSTLCTAVSLYSPVPRRTQLLERRTHTHTTIAIRFR